MIHITLKDGSVKEFESGVSVIDVAKSLGAGLAKAACCGRINGEAVDLRTPITEDCQLEICTFDDEDGKKAFWHTAAHVMAQAIQHLFPGAKFGIGPALESGWYYDIGGVKPFTPDQFGAIEAEMKKIVKENIPVEKRIITVEEGRSLFAGQDYKLELLEEYAEKGWELSVYTQGDFTDLCAGPHLMSIRRDQSSQADTGNQRILARRCCPRQYVPYVRRGIPESKRVGCLPAAAGGSPPPRPQQDRS